MQTVDELKYSQSVWGFQPRKAEIRKVCDVKGLLRDRNHLDVCKDRFRQRCQIVPLVRKTLKCPDCGTEILLSSAGRERYVQGLPNGKLLRNEDCLDSKGAADLERIREINSDLADAHMLKERLRAIYATAKNGFDAYCLLRGWCAAADATGVPELAAMAKTIRSHIKGILGYWKLDGATNASMEGFNGKVRWLIKQAYGFKDFKYFRLKIFDLPSTDIRKRL